MIWCSAGRPVYERASPLAIDSYGLLSNRTETLARCRAALGVELVDARRTGTAQETRQDTAIRLLGHDPFRCPARISHSWLLANIPMNREVLRKWLEAGYLEDATFPRTLAGTPQGGIISPVIANLALDGLEEAARAAVPGRSHGCPATIGSVH